MTRLISTECEAADPITRPDQDTIAPEAKSGSEIVRITGPDNLSRMSVEELKAELAKTFLITARHILQIAEIWNELRRRGQDMSGFRSGLWKYMPAIASGELLPELVVRYAGNSRLLKRLSELPRYEQDVVFRAGTVNVAESNKGLVTHRTVPIEQLTPQETKQVFRGKVLSVKEQQALMSGSSHHGASASTAQLKRRVFQAASQRNCKKVRYSERRVTFTLPFDDWNSLKDHADESGITVSALVASALKTVGLT